MQSIKTLSLILVASTLIPASAHAWSWSDVVKPAAALATCATGKIFADYFLAQSNKHFVTVCSEHEAIHEVPETPRASKETVQSLYQFLTRNKAHNEWCACRHDADDDRYDLLMQRMEQAHKDLSKQWCTQWNATIYKKHWANLATAQQKDLHYRIATGASCVLGLGSAAYLVYFLGKPAVNYATNYLSNKI